MSRSVAVSTASTCSVEFGHVLVPEAVHTVESREVDV
jgi:hypothetical protein